jgi:hypothetical protein
MRRLEQGAPQLHDTSKSRAARQAGKPVIVSRAPASVTPAARRRRRCRRGRPCGARSRARRGGARRRRGGSARPARGGAAPPPRASSRGAARPPSPAPASSPPPSPASPGPWPPRPSRRRPRAPPSSPSSALPARARRQTHTHKHTLVVYLTGYFTSSRRLKLKGKESDGEFFFSFHLTLLLTHLCARGGVLDLALPPDGAALQLVGGLELRGAEVAEVVLEAAAVEEGGELVLQLHPGLGVQQLDRGGGAPAAAPEVEVLGGGGPGRGEHAEHVVGRGRRLGAVVLRVVAEHLAHEAPELGLGRGGVRGRRGAQLLEVAGLLRDPGLEELGEGLVGRQRRREGAVAPAAVGGRRRRGGHGDRCGVVVVGWRWALAMAWMVVGLWGARARYKGSPCRPLRGTQYSSFGSLLVHIFQIFKNIFGLLYLKTVSLFP